VAVLGPMLAFGVPGLKEMLLIGLVALAFYGRGGSRLLMATRSGRSISPWLDLIRIPAGTRAGPRRGASNRPAPAPEPAPVVRRQSRWFWALALTAAAAVAALVATRIVILSGSPVAR